MKWMGIAITSAIMGVFLAVLAQTAFPRLTHSGFLAAAVAASVLIFAILMRLALTAGTIDVRPPIEWDIHHKLRNT